MESEEPRITTNVLFNLYYTMLAVQVVAAAISIVIFVGLLIPLRTQLKNGTFHQSTRPQRSARGEPPYSTYNLYVVYLAFVDLVYLGIQITFESMALNQGNGPYLPASAFLSLGPYSYANLWINAAIVYEVFALLRATKSGKRITQPSFMRVNLQAGGLLVASIAFAVLNIYSLFVGWIPELAFGLLGYLMYFLPLFYVIGVTVLVKCKGFLPPKTGKTARDKAVRGLALFFFRVILVFVVIWIPVMVLVGLGNFHNAFTLDFVSANFFYILMNLISAFQPILTFCMILSKPDVKKYITDLVTLTYILGDSNCCSCNRNLNKDNVSPGINGLEEGGIESTRRTSLLGYNFDDDDDDNAIDSDSDAAEEVEANEDNSQTIANAIASNADDNRDRNNHTRVDMAGEIPQ